MPALAGRKLWFVGIGGAGMSGIALVAQARGATVAGSDNVRSETTARLEEHGITITIGHDASNVPEGFEVVASSAIPADNPELHGRDVRRRAAVLGELLEPGRSIVVAGSHGKTTTASMIAYCLDRLGNDPTFVIGGEVPQLGTNARHGSGWMVAEGDESDGSLLELAPTIAVLTNVDHDHHSAFASRADVEKLFEAWLNGVAADATVVRGEDVTLSSDVTLAVAGAHNRANAACAVQALEHAGFARPDVEGVITEFAGAARRLETHGTVNGVELFDDYAHHPTELEAALRAARTLVPKGGRLVVLFQPHLFTRTAYLADEFATALALADRACVTAIYPAREQPRPGVSAKLVTDALSRRRPGMRIGLAATVESAALIVGNWLRPDDLVLTAGAGDVYRAIPLLQESLA
ncbi:MAG: UDP-N-acetylmuramate--L-alanine ligase [Gaiellaceae bacterium]